ncbi:hypothetical protein BJV82DRAFT_593480 [Fennellomyces sp. T-0311]|nr:hypothetical protein BJV82DRAFT_593480 [Fennellomyces sp. T-0311]
MHNSAKIELPSQNDFYDVMDKVQKGGNEISKDVLAQESRRTQQLVRERMDQFYKNMTLIAGNNVTVGDGEPINLEGLNQEPFNASLESEALELAQQTREAIENVVHQRKNAIKEMGVLSKEVIHQRYLLNREFEQDDPIDQEQDQSADIGTMLKEYQDAQRLLSRFEKTLANTKMSAEQLDEVLKCGKLL